MALVKSIVTEIGVVAEYHKISGVHAYPDKRVAHIDVASYVSKDTHDAGSMPVVTSQFEFTGEQYPFCDTSFGIDDAYEAVKTRDIFAAAQEV